MDKLEGREDRVEGVQWSRRSSRGVESARDGYIETGEWGRGEIDVPCFISTVDRKTMPSSPQAARTPAHLSALLQNRER